MFDSLEEQMKHDDAMTNTRQETVVKWVLYVVVPIVVFIAALTGIWMMG